MESNFVITLVAADRPGIVEAVARAVSELGGNWLESRMSRLGGQFAGILRISLPAEAREKLLEALRQFEAEGWQLQVVASPPGEAHATSRQAVLQLLGQDRPGIVRQISQALARHGVNVEEFSSQLVSAPMSGEPLFQAEARVSIPAHCTLAILQGELEKIAADLMVDAKFQISAGA